jgi:carbon starvation protein
MIQDLIGNVMPGFRATESWVNNIIGSGIACA